MASSKAIVVSTHILEEVEAVCSRAVIIDKGRIVADGTAEDLQRRLPHHNAVAVRVPADAAAAAVAALKGVNGVRGVEELSRENGHAELRALPAGTADIVGDVAAMLREKSIGVDQIYIERGSLDDVFREITTADETGRDAGRLNGGAHA